jgi:hypothetical protein
LLAEYSFDDPQKNYYIIIDQLDDNWAENDTRYKFIRALIEEIKVFRKIKNIKIIAALRWTFYDQYLILQEALVFRRKNMSHIYLI